MSQTPPHAAEGPSAAAEPWCATLFEAHPHAVLVVETSGRLLHANRAAQWLAAGGRVSNLSDLLEPGSGEALREALRDSRGWSGPLTLRAADGSTSVTEFHLLAPAHPTRIAGELVCIVERANAAHRTPALLWQADAGFAFRWVNQASVNFTGRPVEALLGRGWLDTVHPEDRERATGIFLTSQQARVPFSMDLRLRRHDGEYRCMLVHGTPEDDGYVGIALEIHERHELEMRLAEHTGAPTSGRATSWPPCRTNCATRSRRSPTRPACCARSRPTTRRCCGCARSSSGRWTACAACSTTWST